MRSAAASSLDPVHVVFTVDGKVVYEGSRCPMDPRAAVADLGAKASQGSGCSDRLCRTGSPNELTMGQLRPLAGSGEGA